jgi:hypothetical protein
VRGQPGEVTYAAAPTTDVDAATGEDATDTEPPPEQSAFDDRPEINPDSPGAHESDPSSNRGHGV